jgi:tetratricopeptide (TPR) repeat protein
MLKYFITLLLATAFSYCSFAQTTAQEWYDKGIALKKDKNYTEAITAFKKATELKANYALALHQLGWCYNEKGLYNEAIAALKKEELAGPEDKASNDFELAYANEELKKYDEALSYLNKALDIDPDYALAYKERGTVYFKSLQYTKVLDDYNKYESLVTDEISDPDFYYRKGWVLDDQEKYADAITALKKAVTLDDRYTDAFSELGYACYKLQKNDDAIKYYRGGMAIDPTDYHPVLGLADVYYDNLKNYDSAIVYYKKGIGLEKTHKTAYYRLGWCYNDRKQYTDAVAPLKEAVSLDADYKDARNELGYAYYKLDKYDDALAQFEMVMNKDANNELSRYYAGFCYYLKNDQGKLKKMISELKALNSTEYAETLEKYVK